MGLSGAEPGGPSGTACRAAGPLARTGPAPAGRVPLEGKQVAGPGLRSGSCLPGL